MWQQSFVDELIKLAKLTTEEKNRRRATVRFKKFDKILTEHGVDVGSELKRVKIPKTKINEADIKSLGFVPVKVAIPETGQKRFTSFRHPYINHHIHDHGEAWVMHKDSHPSLTMVRMRKKLDKAGKSYYNPMASTIPGGKKTEAPGTLAGIKHIVSEGIPGAALYAKNQLTKGVHMLDRVEKKTTKEVRSKYKRWVPTEARTHALSH